MLLRSSIRSALEIRLNILPFHLHKPIHGNVQRAVCLTLAESIHMTIFCQCNRELSSTGNFFYSNSTKNIHFLWGKGKGKPAIVLQGYEQKANTNLICNSCFQKIFFFILTVQHTYCRIILIQETETPFFFFLIE